MVRGDFGRSIPKNNQPVLGLIMSRLPATLMLTVTSLVLTYMFSIPDRTLVDRQERHVGRADGEHDSLHALLAAGVRGGALPATCCSTSKLGWLPLFGMTSDNYATLSTSGKVWDIFQHALLPIICFTYGSLAYYSRFIRANMQEVIRQDYIRTAKAKGVPPRRVLWHHAFRNTLIPLVTLIGLTLPQLLSGAVILEQIFSWPGMGRLFFESIGQRDYDTLMGLTLMFSVLTLLGSCWPTCCTRWSIRG